MQDFGFKDRAYDRPNEKWVCGRLGECDACPAGPDHRGQCHATFECHPVREGDRWKCNRMRQGTNDKPCDPGPTPGGKCCRAITPCTPVRSLRSRRGLAVLLTLGVSLGVMLLVLFHPAGGQFVSPGELSHAHSSVNSTCTDCHASGVGMPADWFHRGTSLTPGAQSRKCLECHSLGPSPMHPHSQHPVTLAALARNAPGEHAVPPLGLLISAPLRRAPPFATEEIACARCHVEHQGKDHDLTRISNNQCQTCHQSQFASFKTGHPQFGDYPFVRRTRITFDHDRHLNIHFKEAFFKDAAPDSCLDCHKLDDRGETMMVDGFERSCAVCHSKDFTGADPDAPGIPFLRVPFMDAEAFADPEVAIGQWPDDWDSLDVFLTPFTRFLLSRDQSTSADVLRVGMEDLGAVKDEDLPAASRVAWDLKAFLAGAAERGTDELADRIAGALGHELDRDDLDALKRMVPPGMFGKVADAWFPKLEDELKLKKSGEAPESALMNPDDMAKRLSVDQVVLGGGWYRSDVDLTLYYRPAHHQDPFMRLWLKLAVGAGRVGAPDEAPTLFESLAGNSNQVAPGRCAKCHSAEPGPSPTMNWRAARPDRFEHKSNKFSHESHFALLNEKGCTTCHGMAPRGDNQNYLAGFQYHRSPDSQIAYASNFQAIDKATCAQCHTRDQAGENCLSCHNYHVGRFQDTALKGALFHALDKLPETEKTQ